MGNWEMSNDWEVNFFEKTCNMYSCLISIVFCYQKVKGGLVGLYVGDLNLQYRIQISWWTKNGKIVQ